MKLSSLFALGLILLLCFSLIAEEKAEEKAEKKPARKAAAGPVAAIEKQIATLELGPDQKEKVDKILSDYKAKFAAAQAKNKGAVLTADQKKAQKEAAAKAKSDGKNRKDARADIDAAVKLTDEQKKAQEQVAAANKELQAGLKKDLSAVLSAEQVAKVGLGGRKKKNT